MGNIKKTLEEYDKRNRTIQEFREINSFLQRFRNDPAFKMHIKTYNITGDETSEIVLMSDITTKILNTLSEKAHKLESEITSWKTI
jgi:hypothetical protein